MVTMVQEDFSDRDSNDQSYQHSPPNTQRSIEDDVYDRTPLLGSQSTERDVTGGGIVYLCFLLMGLGTLLPWNFFITAESYWQYKFRNSTEGPNDWKKRETYLQKLYDPMQVCFSQATNFLFLFINAIFGHLYPQKLRLGGSLVVMTGFFIVTTVLAKVNTDSWQLGLFVLTIFTIVILSATGATFQGGLFGVAGKFPQRFINAVGIGQALGGVFASVARVVSIYLGADIVIAAFIYFLIAVVVMGLTLFEYLYVCRTNFFQFYANKNPLEESLVDDPNHKPERKTLSGLLREHFEIFKKIWTLGVSICFVFFITLSLFPVISVKVLSTSSNKVWANKYFQPVITFLLFNVCDYLGRTLAELILWPRIGSRLLYWMSFFRVVFIPLFLLCNHDPYSAVPSVFTNDAFYIVFMTLFGFSNGYSFALLMMYAPRMVSESEGETVGCMMAAMIGLGLLIGSLTSFGFALIS